MLSSVTLKSPNMKSGRLSPMLLLAVSISSQNVVCSPRGFGAYMFTSIVSSFSSHLIFKAAARPGWSSYTLYSLGLISVLFITNATPAVARGFVGCWEFMISSRFPKQAFTFCRRSWSKWVSCRARIVILLSLMVRLIVDHLSIPDMLLAGAAKPFTFRVAIVILAFCL